MAKTMLKQQIRLAGLSLFLVFIGIYSLSYLGLWLGTDELHIFDSTESLVKRGNLDVTIQYVTNSTPDSAGNEIGEPSRYEPMQIILAAPFYYVASQFPNVGLMHAIWFLNIPITALTVVLLYIIALHEGYSWQIAWLGSFLFGLGTQALPYSRWFYRDPLSAFSILICFGIVLKLRKNFQTNRPYWMWGLGFAIAYLFAFFSKQVVVLILPSVFILLWDRKILKRRNMWILVGGLIGLTLIALSSIFLLNLSDSRQLGFIDDLGKHGTWLIESLAGYTFSPSRSMWLYSPILVLMIPGSVILWRKDKARLVGSIWLSFLTFSLSYGFRHDWNWWGSWSWGPRYLLPILPLQMLLIFPVLAEIDQSSRRVWGWVGVGCLFLASVTVQMVGMGVSYSNYYSELELAHVFDGNVADKRWEYYNWDWGRAPFAYHLKHFDWNHLWIWNISQPSWVVPALSIFTIGLALILISWHRHNFLKIRILISALASLVLPAILFASMLYTLQDDPRYTNYGQQDDVRQLITELNTKATDDEIIFVERLADMVLYMNFAKHYSWLIVLPSAPGEQYGDIQPEIVSANVREQIGFRNIYALEWSKKYAQTAWLATSYSPFHVGQLRPIEHFMAMNYFPISEIYLTPEVRAVHYLFENAPLYAPTNQTKFKFGTDLELIGYDLVNGTEYSVGDTVPLSLVWKIDEPLPLDYNIGVLVLAENQQLVADRNGIPQGTFGLTSQWELGKVYRDNHGLALPQDLPPGQYTIEVAIYYWQDLQNLPVTLDGENMGDRAVVATITVK